MTGGDCTKQAPVSKNIYGNCFHTDDHIQNTNSWENKEWKVVWLYSVRHGSFEEVETSFCKLSPSIEKHSGRSQRYWQVVEAVCTRRWLDVLASKIANLRLQVTKQNAHYSSTVVSSAIGACCYKNTPFC